MKETQLYLVPIASELWVASGNYMFRPSWWPPSGCTYYNIDTNTTGKLNQLDVEMSNTLIFINL